MQQVVQLGVERRIGVGFGVGLLQLLQRGHQRLRHIAAAVDAKAACPRTAAESAIGECQSRGELTLIGLVPSKLQPHKAKAATGSVAAGMDFESIGLFR